MSVAKPRMNRLFAASGKCFDVAIDHGFFNERGFLTGIENLERSVLPFAATICRGSPKAGHNPHDNRMSERETHSSWLASTEQTQEVE